MRPYKWIRQPNDQRVVMSSLGGDEVIAKFRCDNCGTWIYTNAIEIPEPNMAGENNLESEVIIESEAYCTNEECAKSFNIYVSNSFGGSDFEIEDILWTDIFFKYYDEELERIFSATDYYGLFEESLEAINSMVNIEIDDDHRKILNRMLLSHSVTAMESYLLNALTILTLQTEERIANALQSIDRFNYRKYSNEIIAGDKDAIISAILNSLKDESFHNLKKVNMVLREDIKYRDRF